MSDSAAKLETSQTRSFGVIHVGSDTLALGTSNSTSLRERKT